MKKIKCLHQGLDGLKDFTDLKSVQSENPCHLSNPCKSVSQTKGAEVLNAISEWI